MYSNRLVTRATITSYKPTSGPLRLSHLGDARFCTPEARFNFLPRRLSPARLSLKKVVTRHDYPRRVPRIGIVAAMDARLALFDFGSAVWNAMAEPICIWNMPIRR